MALHSLRFLERNTVVPRYRALGLSTALSALNPGSALNPWSFLLSCMEIVSQLKVYRRRRRFATAATAPRIFGIFFTTILNIKPKKIIKHKWLVCK